MKLTLKIWRQTGRKDTGKFVSYPVNDVNPEMSMLECLDVLNETLIERGEEPVAFEHDCREGICGSCGFMINGVPHGPMPATTVCQLTMRHFKDGEELIIEPWRAAAFPAIKDLVVDRRSFDRIIAAGGYISVSTGNAPDGNAILVSKETSDRAMDAAACIGCGACVAACPNASSALFTGAKIAHLSVLPQGVPERDRRALQHGGADERGRLWRLHQHRRVHGCVSEGDSARSDCDDEPRLYPRKLEAARPGSAHGEADDGVEHGIEAED